MSDDTSEKESWVRRRAYQLWQDAGEEHGRHEDHWRQAEREYAAATDEPSEPGAKTGDLEQDLIETPPPVAESQGVAPKLDLSTAATNRREPPAGS